jgi:hypothetical protein
VDGTGATVLRAGGLVLVASGGRVRQVALPDEMQGVLRHLAQTGNESQENHQRESRGNHAVH